MRAALSHRWYCRDYELGVFGAARSAAPQFQRRGVDRTGAQAQGQHRVCCAHDARADC